MSNYKDNYGLFTTGTLAEERYSFERYNCASCKKQYRTYYTFSIPMTFMNTIPGAPNPNREKSNRNLDGPFSSEFHSPRWCCPAGCVYSSFHKTEPYPVELVGKCNLLKKGKNCYVKYTYVPHLEPNYTSNTNGNGWNPQPERKRYAHAYAHPLLQPNREHMTSQSLASPNMSWGARTPHMSPTPRQPNPLTPQQLNLIAANRANPPRLFASLPADEQAIVGPRANYHGYHRAIDWNRRRKLLESSSNGPTGRWFY